MEPVKLSVTIAWQSLEEKYLESSSKPEKNVFNRLTDREKKLILLEFLNQRAKGAKTWVDSVMEGLLADLNTPMPPSIVGGTFEQPE